MLVNILCRFEELKGSKLSFAEKMKKVSQEWEKVKKDKQGKVIFHWKFFCWTPLAIVGVQAWETETFWI